MGSLGEMAGRRGHSGHNLGHSLGHRAIHQKYAWDPDIRTLAKALRTPAKQPGPPRPPGRPVSPPASPCEHDRPCHADTCSWSMVLTQYRTPVKQPIPEVDSYPQAVMALARRIRKKSLPPLQTFQESVLPSRSSALPSKLTSSMSPCISRKETMGRSPYRQTLQDTRTHWTQPRNSSSSHRGYTVFTEHSPSLESGRGW